MNYSITVLETELVQTYNTLDMLEKYPISLVKDDLIKIYSKRLDDLLSGVAVLRDKK